MHQIFDVCNLFVRIKAYAPYFCFCHQNKTQKTLSKMILFSQKKPFYPGDFQIFVLSSFLFFPFLGISGFIEEVDWW